MNLDDFIKRIETIEKDVDRVLKAARLERHEKVPMSMERLKFLVEAGLMALGMVLIFAFFFMLFYLRR